VPEQLDALQRAAELGEQRVHVRAHTRGARLVTPVAAGVVAKAPGPARSKQVRHRRSMPPRDLFERIVQRRIGMLGQPGALEELVGDALEGGHYPNHRLAPARVEQETPDLADRRRSRQRGSAKFEDSHDV